MNADAQRIAIAEACGWRFEHLHKGSAQWAEVLVVFDPAGEKHYGWDPKPPPHKSGAKLQSYREGVKRDMDKILPNYLGDLNAMHEVEKVLTEDKSDLRGKDERCRFIAHLGEIVGCWNSGQTHNSLFQQAHATAAQRAEAFLRTLGKFIE